MNGLIIPKDKLVLWQYRTYYFYCVPSKYILFSPTFQPTNSLQSNNQFHFLLFHFWLFHIVTQAVLGAFIQVYIVFTRLISLRVFSGREEARRVVGTLPRDALGVGGAELPQHRAPRAALPRPAEEGRLP